MSVCVDFNYTIKAENKEDFNFIKTLFKKNSFDDVDFVPNYMERMICECECNNKLHEITFSDCDYAHPDAAGFHLEILKYIVRKNKSISFESTCVESCTDGENTERRFKYKCVNGKLDLLHCTPLQLFIDEKCECSGCIFEGIDYYEYEAGLLELEEPWCAWFSELYSSSYQEGMYFLDEEEPFDNIDSMKESLISAYEQLLEENGDVQVYAIFINNGEKKGFHYTFDGEEIQEVELEVGENAYSLESIDVFEIKKFDCDCNNEEHEDDEEYYEDDEY